MEKSFITSGPGLEDINLSSMLNAAEHDIDHVHNCYKNGWIFNIIILVE